MIKKISSFVRHQVVLKNIDLVQIQQFRGLELREAKNLEVVLQPLNNMFTSLLNIRCLAKENNTIASLRLHYKSSH